MSTQGGADGRANHEHRQHPPSIDQHGGLHRPQDPERQAATRWPSPAPIWALDPFSVPPSPSRMACRAGTSPRPEPQPSPRSPATNRMTRRSGTKSRSETGALVTRNRIGTSHIVKSKQHNPPREARARRFFGQELTKTMRATARGQREPMPQVLRATARAGEQTESRRSGRPGQRQDQANDNGDGAEDNQHLRESPSFIESP